MASSRKGMSCRALWGLGSAWVNTSDDELMVRGAAGDDEAYRILVQRWEGAVFSFLLHMLGGREDAQDLTQEAFLRMVASAPRYQATGQFRSWLLRIAGNLARSRLRRRRVIRWLSFDAAPVDPPHDSPSALQEIERRERREEVQRAIRRLPVRQREALVLKQYHGLKYDEIALAMGVTTPAVQMLLHRAMTALREDLGRQGGKR